MLYMVIKNLQNLELSQGFDNKISFYQYHKIFVNHSNEPEPTNWKKYLYTDQKFVIGTLDDHVPVLQTVRMPASSF